MKTSADQLLAIVVIDEVPWRPRPKHRRAWTQFKDSLARGDVAAAEASLRSILAGSPYEMPLWIQLGELLDLQGRTADAEAALAEALDLDPSFLPAASGLLSIRLRAGRNAEAVAVLDRTDPPRRVHPDAIGEYCYLASIALRRTGQREEAEGLLELLRQAAPFTRAALIARRSESFLGRLVNRIYGVPV